MSSFSAHQGVNSFFFCANSAIVQVLHTLLHESRCIPRITSIPNISVTTRRDELRHHHNRTIFSGNIRLQVQNWNFRCIDRYHFSTPLRLERSCPKDEAPLLQMTKLVSSYENPVSVTSMQGIACRGTMDSGACKVKEKQEYMCMNRSLSCLKRR